MTLPRLRIIRQFSHILRTEALTFILLKPPKLVKSFILLLLYILPTKKLPVMAVKRRCIVVVAQKGRHIKNNLPSGGEQFSPEVNYLTGPLVK